MHYQNKRWTPERIKEFGDYYKTHTVKQLAEKFFYTENTCRDLIKRFGLSKRRPALWEEGDDYLIVGLHVERLSAEKIAEKMDKSTQVIYNRISYLKSTGEYYKLFSQYVQDNNHKFKG